MDKKNKVFLIVGGAQSLGKYLTIKLLEQKFSVIMVDVKKKLSISWINSYPNLTYFECDASNENQVKEIFKKINSKNLKINNLIYNAGYAKAAKITEIEFSNIKNSLNVNYIGYMLFAKHIARHMINNKIKGSLININSKSGKTGSKHNASYSGAKFGAVGITQSVALDLAEHGIRVNSLMLGNLLESKMFNSLLPQYAKKLNIREENVKNYYINKVPLKRGCNFEDVFNVMMFYISEKANYITGQSINITGGQVMF